MSRKTTIKVHKTYFWWCLCTNVVPKAINLSPDSITFGEYLSLFIKLFSFTLIFHFSVEASTDIGLVFTNFNPISRFFQVHYLPSDKCVAVGTVSFHVRPSNFM